MVSCNLELGQRIRNKRGIDEDGVVFAEDIQDSMLGLARLLKQGDAQSVYLQERIVGAGLASSAGVVPTAAAVGAVAVAAAAAGVVAVGAAAAGAVAVGAAATGVAVAETVVAGIVAVDRIEGAVHTHFQKLVESEFGHLDRSHVGGAYCFQMLIEHRDFDTWRGLGERSHSRNYCRCGIQQKATLLRN